ncbi:hypothetical protein BDV3_003070 [Batrachochytrium dendrobatidis]
MQVCPIIVEPQNDSVQAVISTRAMASTGLADTVYNTESVATSFNSNHSMSSHSLVLPLTELQLGEAALSQSLPSQSTQISHQMLNTSGNNLHEETQPDRSLFRLHGRSRSSSAAKNVVTAFELQLDQNKTTFLPGQRIDGHVGLSISSECSVKLLRVRFSGLISTYTNKRKNRKPNTDDQQSIVFLFREIFNHLGSGQPGHPPVILEAGDHTFPFSFRVPPTSLPASFVGPYGEIRYEVAAIFLHSYLPKQMVTVPITIPSTLDVNTSELQEPKTIELTCGAGRLWWKSGHIDICASLPRHGFTSEDTASLKIEIVNHSANALIIQDIALKQQVMYKAFAEVRGPRTERIHKINFSERIGATTRKITRLVQFPIPASSVISPDISTPVLQVTHSIGFKVQSCAPWSQTCKVYLPIVIAGFPFTLFDDNLLRRSVDTLPIYDGSRGTVEPRTPGMASISKHYCPIE